MSDAIKVVKVAQSGGLKLVQLGAASAAHAAAAARRAEEIVAQLQEKPVRRHAFDPNTNTDFIGVAPFGATESDPVWRITRQVVAPNGTGTVTQAIDVTWTGYATHIYA